MYLKLTWKPALMLELKRQKLSQLTLASFRFKLNAQRNKRRSSRWTKNMLIEKIQCNHAKILNQSKKFWLLIRSLPKIAFHSINRWLHRKRRIWRSMLNPNKIATGKPSYRQASFSNTSCFMRNRSNMYHFMRKISWKLSLMMKNRWCLIIDQTSMIEYLWLPGFSKSAERALSMTKTYSISHSSSSTNTLRISGSKDQIYI